MMTYSDTVADNMAARPGDAPPALTPFDLGLTSDQKRAYEREHRIAESLQRILLRTPPRGTLPGICVAAFYEAATEEATVGGDSYDAFVLSGGKIALAVADASGKGLEAAERVAEIRFALRAFLSEHGDPGVALSCLNDFVCDAQRLGRRDDTFATLTLVVLDSASGEAACLCAGGEPPLVLRAGGAVEEVQTCGAALGLFPCQGYTAATMRLAAGDAVLIATDGITEAQRRAKSKAGPAGAFLGLAGLARLAVRARQVKREELLRSKESPLSHIGRSIFEDARRFAGGTFHDDASLLLGPRE